MSGLRELKAALLFFHCEGSHGFHLFHAKPHGFGYFHCLEWDRIPLLLPNLLYRIGNSCILGHVPGLSWEACFTRSLLLFIASSGLRRLFKWWFETLLQIIREEGRSWVRWRAAAQESCVKSGSLPSHVGDISGWVKSLLKFIERFQHMWISPIMTVLCCLHWRGQGGGRKSLPPSTEHGLIHIETSH